MAVVKKQPLRRQSEVKSFQCTGYGDCHMVFTRSEHLARHARKHTGEKPFKCVVPGCERAFSRFDNMIQHTSTHSKHQGDDKGPGNTKKKQQQQQRSKAAGVNKSHPSKPTQHAAGLVEPSTTMYTSLPYSSTPMESSWSSSISDYDHLSPLPTFLTSPKHHGLHYPDPYLDGEHRYSDHLSSASSASSFSSSSPRSESYSIMSPPTSSFGSFAKAGVDDPTLPLVPNGGHGMYLTVDEVEALQGMSQLSSLPTTSLQAHRPRYHHHHHHHHPTALPSATFSSTYPQQFRWTRESSSRFTPRSSL
ncbi:hypothetical protein [Absidia glauca]|uniref:C2H2-type domain-containing protein n=1 Tax=Absidia glauca TaxID=4829 RepID=A0A163K1L0_ABSGL|nr:hypothetical protein [Absidia glauca]